MFSHSATNVYRHPLRSDNLDKIIISDIIEINSVNDYGKGLQNRGHIVRKVSIKDVAKKAGVSTATVSRVLNNQGGYSKETAETVRRIIRKTGFSVNLSAKALRTQKTHSVRVVIPDITNEYFAVIARGIDTYFLQRGFSVLIADSNESVDQETIRLRDMIQKNVDRIIFIAAQKTSSAVGNYPMPIVHVDRTLRDAQYCVISDNCHGGELAARELVSRGCKRILLIRDQHRTSPVLQREKGFSRWIRHHAEHVNIMDITCLPNYDKAMGVIRETFKQDLDFDGIFASNDQIAVIAVNLLKQWGKSVPEDVKVVGFDDTSIARFTYPSLTTIRQDTDQIAKISAQMLFRLIQGETVPEQEVVVPVELVVRQSTGSTAKTGGDTSGTVS